jgi:hypothetical protein
MELELTEEEAAILGEALECFIVHPTTDDDSRHCAIDLAHHLLALAAGHFDDWGDDSVNHTFTQTEQDFIQQGIEAREQVKETSRAATRREQRLAFGEFEVEEPVTPAVTNDPINW